jgi:heat shock protein HslJ
MIRVDPSGRISLHRSGIQDQVAGGADLLLDRLREFGSRIRGLDGAAPSPMGHTYLSTAVTENGEPKQLVPKTRIRVEFARTPNQNRGGPRVYDVLRVHAGCNRIDTAVAAGELQVDSEELMLTSGGTTITLLNKKIAEPDLPLDGIRWKVDTTITNADLRHHRYNTEPAWIRIDGEHLTGWTGCNELSGTVTRNKTQLTFTGVTTTDRTCTGETAEVQSEILATLRTAVTYTIDHNNLTLLAPSGIGLDLKAD